MFSAACVCRHWEMLSGTFPLAAFRPLNRLRDFHIVAGACTPLRDAEWFR